MLTTQERSVKQPCRPHRDCRQQADRRCMRLRLRLVSARRRRGDLSVPLTARAISRRLKHVKAVQSPRVGRRQSDITTRVARSTSYLGHTPVGGQVTTAEQPVSVARDDLSRSGRGGEHRSRSLRLSFSWPTTACTSLLSPVHRPCGERDVRDRAVRAVRLAVPVPKFKPFQSSVSLADSRAKSGVP